MPPGATSPPENCLTRNDWICGEYLRTRATDLAEATGQHLGIVVASVLLGLVLAFPLALLARRYRRLEALVLGTTTAIYTIPSLALFSLLVPVTGLGVETVVLGLGLYSLTILVRNVLAGLNSVPSDVREAAVGNGYGPGRLLLTVELPLALPIIMAGLRVATVSTVALATIGTIVASGGLGQLLSDGFDTDFKAEILAASLLCVVMAVALDLILVVVQRFSTPWTRVRSAA